MYVHQNTTLCICCVLRAAISATCRALLSGSVCLLYYRLMSEGILSIKNIYYGDYAVEQYFRRWSGFFEKKVTQYNM